MPKTLAERKAGIIARQAMLDEIFSKIEDQTPTPIGQYHPYFAHVRTIQEAWFWTDEPDVDEDLFIDLLYSIDEHLSARLQRLMRDKSTYTEQKKRLFSTLWACIEEKRSDEAAFEHFGRLKQFDDTLTETLKKYDRNENDINALLFSYKKRAYAKCVASNAAETDKTFWISMNDQYKEMLGVKYDDCLLQRYATVYNPDPDQKVVDGAKPTSYQMLWALEKIKGENEDPADYQARLVSFNQYLTHELAVIRPLYYAATGKMNWTEDVKTILFAPLQMILDIKEEIDEVLNKQGKRCDELKKLYKEKAESVTEAKTFSGLWNGFKAVPRTEALDECTRCLDEMIESNRVYNKTSYFSSLKKEHILENMVKRLGRMNDLITELNTLTDETKRAAISRIQSDFDFAQKQRENQLDSLTTINKQSIEDEDKHDYHETIMRLFLAPVTEISELGNGKRKLGENKKQTAMIRVYEILWPDMREKWIDKNRVMEKDTVRANRLRNLYASVNSMLGIMIRKSEETTLINRIVALINAMYADTRTLSMPSDEVCNAIEYRMENMGNELKQINDTIQILLSLWPVMHNADQSILTKYNQQLTSLLEKALELTSADQDNVNMNTIFDLKRKVRVAMQPYHGVRWTHEVHAEFSMLEQYYKERFIDKRKYSGIFWGDTRDVRLTSALRCYDNLIETGVIDSASLSGSGFSTWFSRLGNIIAKLFEPLLKLSALFPKPKQKASQQRPSQPINTLGNIPIIAEYTPVPPDSTIVPTPLPTSQTPLNKNTVVVSSTPSDQVKSSEPTFTSTSSASTSTLMLLWNNARAAYDEYYASTQESANRKHSSTFHVAAPIVRVTSKTPDQINWESLDEIFISLRDLHIFEYAEFNKYNEIAGVSLGKTKSFKETTQSMLVLLKELLGKAPEKLYQYFGKHTFDSKMSLLLSAADKMVLVSYQHAGLQATNEILAKCNMLSEDAKKNPSRQKLNNIMQSYCELADVDRLTSTSKLKQ